jgi:hypothetical protein
MNSPWRQSPRNRNYPSPRTLHENGAASAWTWPSSSHRRKPRHCQTQPQAHAVVSFSGFQKLAKVGRAPAAGAVKVLERLGALSRIQASGSWSSGIRVASRAAR